MRRRARTAAFLLAGVVWMAAQAAGLLAADARSFWRYISFGDTPARVGVAVGGTAAQPVIYTGGTLRGQPLLNDFWQAFRYNPAWGTYENLFVSDFLSQGIDQIAVGNVAGDESLEIVVHDRFKVMIYSEPSMTLLSEFYPSHDSFIYQIRLQDVDGCGYSELLIENNGYDADGRRKFQLPGPGIVGQFDSDPALEVISRAGEMIDMSTGSVEWQADFIGDVTYVYAGDVNLDGIQELFQVTLQEHVTCWDTRTRTAKWSYSTPHRYLAGPPVLADVDGDGRPEVLFAYTNIVDALSGDNGALVRSHRLWAGEIRSLTVADVDADTQLELIWGDRYMICVADLATGELEWRNEAAPHHPFTDPSVGDLDGDARPELVFASRSSYGYPSGARIFVFDAETLRQKAVSPSLESHAWDVKLRDLDGDGKMEILVATVQTVDVTRGMIAVLNLAPDGSFVTKYRLSDPRVFDEPFSRVEAADVDGDGRVEVIGCGMLGGTASREVRLYVFDPVTGLVRWRSSHMRSADTVQALGVTDMEGDGRLEIACLLPSGDLFVFDAAGGELKAVLYGLFTAMGRPPGQRGLTLGDVDGNISSLTCEQGQYRLSPVFSPGSDPIDGVNYDAESHLWIAAGASVSLWSAPFAAPLWKTEPHRYGFIGEGVAVLPVAGGVHVFARSPIGVEAYASAGETESTVTGRHGPTRRPSTGPGPPRR